MFHSKGSLFSPLIKITITENSCSSKIIIVEHIMPLYYHYSFLFRFKEVCMIVTQTAGRTELSYMTSGCLQIVQKFYECQNLLWE